MKGTELREAKCFAATTSEGHVSSLSRMRSRHSCQPGTSVLVLQIKACQQKLAVLWSHRCSCWCDCIETWQVPVLVTSFMWCTWSPVHGPTGFFKAAPSSQFREAAVVKVARRSFRDGCRCQLGGVCEATPWESRGKGHSHKCNR